MSISLHFHERGALLTHGFARQTSFAASPKPTVAAPPGRQVKCTCPMHPQVRQMGPGHGPICGMSLEPVVATEATGESPELRDMTRRF
jgi:hypothetical protein